MTDWRPYIGNRLIADHPEGFKVIKPSSSSQEDNPIFCPVCESIMRSELDDDAFKKFKCCDSCATTWAYPNRKKWVDGWRPTPDEIENKYKIRHN